MEAKKKAYELAMKFDSEGETDNAKKCALIAVDEIIKAKPAILKQYEYELNIKYWQVVKQELEKL